MPEPAIFPHYRRKTGSLPCGRLGLMLESADLIPVDRKNEVMMFRINARISAAFVMVIAISSLCAHSVPAGAHAILIDSVPADGAVLSKPPMQAMLRFNAKIIPSLAVVNLMTVSGKKIALPAQRDKSILKTSSDRLVVPLPRLMGGSYILRYKVLATDGHATLGILHFSIK